MEINGISKGVEIIMGDERVYSESQIRDAVKQVMVKYQGQLDKMSFSDMVTVENVLMTFEMFLFVGWVKPEDFEND